MEETKDYSSSHNIGANETSRLKWSIRPMRKDDIKECLEIWRKVELTEAYETVLVALLADPDGFYVAEHDDTGEIVGMCSGTLTKPDTAFMGFYAVEPKYQRIGIGKQLWATTMERLDSSVNVGLYGVPNMSDKYRKAGFVLEDTIRMIIYESEPLPKHNLRLDLLKDVDDTLGYRLEFISQRIDEKMLKKLVDYDKNVQRFSREKLMRIGLTGDDVPLTIVCLRDSSRHQVHCDQQHNSTGQLHCSERKSSCCARPSQESIIEDETLSTSVKSSLSISAGNLGELPTKQSSPIDIPSVGHHENSCLEHLPLSESNEVLGYGTIRGDNTSGAMIGPIYADSSEICEILLKNLIQSFDLKPNNKFSIMALSSNKQACKILKKIGMIEMDQCSRMFTKFIPTASFSKIYYVHTPNFSLF